MNRRTGIVLLITIAVLGGIIYVLNLNPDVANKATPTSPPTPNAQAYLWNVDPTSIKGLTVVDLTKNITFDASTDDKGNWTINQPKSGPGDSQLLTTYANTAASLTISRTIDEVTNLADFGLSQPAYRLELRQSNGATAKATVGHKTVTGESYYVLTDGSNKAVLVTTSSLDTLLGLPAAPPFATPTAVASQVPLPTLPISGTPEVTATP